MKECLGVWAFVEYKCVCVCVENGGRAKITQITLYIVKCSVGNMRIKGCLRLDKHMDLQT